MTRPTPRFSLIALPLLALAAPLPAAAADPELRDTVATLNDSVAQDRMADTITAIVGALMQMPVGPLADAIARVDPESDAAYIPRDATLGEVAGRDPDYADRMGADVRATRQVPITISGWRSNPRTWASTAASISPAGSRAIAGRSVAPPFSTVWLT